LCERCGTVLCRANSRAKQKVLRALKEAPQPTLASHLMSATRREQWRCQPKNLGGAKIFFGGPKCLVLGE